jgi:uncharacterized membrane protein HdeD (DUF308 family)
VVAANPEHGLQGPVATAKKVTSWFIAMAILFIILGVLAIAEPGIAALAVTLLVGWLLIFGGVAHLVSAFSAGGAGRAIWQVLVGIVYFVGGFYFLTHPLIAVGTLTLLLAGIILAEGVLEIIAYFRMKSEGGSSWMLVNGLITLLLGGLIWFQWPSSSVWAIGILVGVNLLVTGITRLMFAMTARKMVKAVAG